MSSDTAIEVIQVGKIFVVIAILGGVFYWIGFGKKLEDAWRDINEKIDKDYR